ncbi:MAG: ACP S-malonyltransferase [Phycisphaerales bacterium]|nr:MAG: ACP S-malonyltransferase [Phycisphaerales bacterium]
MDAPRRASAPPRDARRLLHLARPAQAVRLPDRQLAHRQHHLLRLARDHGPPPRLVGSRDRRDPALPRDHPRLHRADGRPPPRHPPRPHPQTRGLLRDRPPRPHHRRAVPHQRLHALQRRDGHRQHRHPGTHPHHQPHHRRHHRRRCPSAEPVSERPASGSPPAASEPCSQRSSDRITPSCRAPYTPRMIPITLLCPGQGAQAVGMAKAWFDHSPEARRVFEEADRVLGDRLSHPIGPLCFEGPANRLNATDAAQPAIFVAGVACAHALAARWQTPVDRLPLAGAAGLSLGEYTALHLAGAMSFEEALELVALRGAAMQDAAEAQSSGMVALIGATEDQAQALCDRCAGDDVLVPANYNAPGQIVISGHAEACQRAADAAPEFGCKATPLVVAGAFHSPLMQPAADRLAEALARTDLRAPRCPVYSNVTGEPHEADPASIRSRLIEQLTSPVRWAQACAKMHADGLLTDPNHVHELAPGKTLAGIMRRIERTVQVQSHDDPST